MDRALTPAPVEADPDDPRKPQSPTELTKSSWLYVLRSTARQFSRDQCTDLAAALTYYAVLSLFPAILGSGFPSRSIRPRSVDRGCGFANCRRPRSILGSGYPEGTDSAARASPGGWVRPHRRYRGARYGPLPGMFGAFGRAMNRMYEGRRRPSSGGNFGR